MEHSVRRRRSTLLESVTNPFQNDVPWTPYQKALCALTCWNLFPLRVLTLLVAFPLHIGICAVATLGVKASNDRGCICPAQPFPAWRMWLLTPAILTNRILLWCFGYWYIKVSDRRKNKSYKCRVLSIAPHLTFIDPFVMNTVYPPMLSGVGKIELLKMPLLGKLGLATQGIYVDRKKPDSRKACGEAINRQARQEWKGPPLVIFPEGTTCNGKALIEFKAGAFMPGEPVQPVCLRYPYKHYNPAWCGQNSNLGMAVLRCMLQIVNHCEIVLLEPYFPSEEEKKDAKLYAKNVRAIMAKELGVGTTDHSYDDLFFSVDALKAKARIDQDFVIADVKSTYDLDIDQLKRLLKQFQRLDSDRSGSLSYEQFATALRNANAGIYSEEASIDHIFTFFDTDGTGEISYREFIQGAAIFSGKCSNQTRAKLAFLLFDMDGTGCVKISTLRKALEDPLGERVEAAAKGSSEFDYSSFCELVEKEPDVVEKAMDIARAKFSFEGSTNSEAIEGDVPSSSKTD